MAAPDNQHASETSVSRDSLRWTCALLIAIWAPLLWRLTRMWRSEAEQWFGFGVPLLVGWLFWRRRKEWSAWAERGGGAGWLAVSGALAVGMGLLALEANPLWPKAAWLGASGTVALSLGALAWVHGWRGARACAPVLLLMLTALKWPTFVYEPVMRSLMQINAVIAAELVNWLGTPAVVLGNVIEVARGMVGIDEACSGLRSLQTVVMMALFLGESERLRLGRRFGLLAGAVMAALFVNVIRTTVLTWLFANLGPEVEERWHDPAGLIALFATLALVWWLSEWLSRTSSSAQEPASVEAGNGAANTFCLRPLVVSALAVAAIEAGTQAWYFSHERDDAPRVSWSLVAPTNSEWRTESVPRRAAELLQVHSYDGWARQLNHPRREMLAFAFRWPGDLARMGMPEMHDPLVCLPSVGAVKEAELPEARVEIDGVEVPFRFVRFRQGVNTQHVWFCLWGTRAPGSREIRGGGLNMDTLRWSRVRDGLRNDEREQLIFFVQGDGDDAAAETTLRDAVLTLMRRR